ncbi:S8 family serine peptidase [Polycladomyces subterraneus]|uniref:S8 family serine peptidase n=1 Tax=Polycladomyces subterraneus TaxID=1016997 RepID=A0ABT8IJI4_9BACL|nr:S8 family serine peptidase [Polycladomyces subterraneus]MDN4592334.1 S8 family serine peptidase [Polycladomyces subterraneus]
MRRRMVVVALICLLLMTWMMPVGGTQAASLPKVDPILQNVGQLAKLTDLSRVRAVVTYYDQPTAADVSLLQALGLKIRTFRHLPMVAVEGPYVQLQQLFQRGEIRSIYYDKPLRYLLKDSVPYIGADRVWNNLGYTGKGVTVAVIDSGIDATHSDLKFGDKTIQNVKMLLGNSLFGGDTVYLENVQNTDTTSGHGTHVSGIIAGNGTASDGTYKGVAPGAKLVGIGTGEAITIIWALEAFDYVLEKKDTYHIRVISNSWGTSGDYDPNDPINVASKKAHDAGMVVVFAAGNEGPDNNTLNPYSVAPWVIGVAAGTKDGKLADFSSRGVPGDPLLHPTITAPGVDIVSTRSATGLVLNLLGTKKDVQYIPPQYLPYYTTASGTSMATPHISGVTALMLEANPQLTPDQVKNLLVQTARPMSGYQKYQVGAGYVDAYQAVVAAKNAP